MTAVPALLRSPAVAGVACGLGAAFCWAAGLVAARHGIAVGFTPADLAFHRFVWPGFLVLPLLWRAAPAQPATFWTRGLILTVLGGPVLAIVSYSGFLLVPLGHGAVVQPSAAATGGLVLAALVLGEPLRQHRILGLLAIVAGLVLLAAESLSATGLHAVGGDLLFVLAGLTWATFGTLVRLWNMPARQAASVVCGLSVLLYAPVHAALFGFGSMLRPGVWENLLQIVVQAGLAGPLAIHLYARAAILLGAARTAAFPAMVPLITLLLGALLLGEIPTALQFAGLAVVCVGFRLVLKR